jgi:hypothetical protein
MPALSFDTDTMQVSGGLSGTGQLATNKDGSLMAVFSFHDVDLATQPAITGSRPFVLMSEGDLRITVNVSVKGGNGAHTTHGTGIAGGGDGGDANRSETSGNPLAGQGPGGSPGNSSGAEDSSSGGGGFGGAGGDGTSTGGPAYGDPFLSSLSGGSGAGGTRNKGGGAGGGGIGLVAADVLEIMGSATIDAQGGKGAASVAQFTSGGGSGGGIVLRGSSIILQGTLNASGGNGGNASGGQLNGGGGGGGRIAVYYHTSLNTNDSSISVSGGIPLGSNETANPGAVGTIHFGLDDEGRANQWLIVETGNSNVTASAWDMDYDNDGLSARIEYAIGGTTTTDDRSLLPLLENDGSGGFDFVYNRRLSGKDVADYQVETTTNLLSPVWVMLAPDELRTTPHPTLSDFEVVRKIVPGDQSRRFIRLRVR